MIITTVDNLSALDPKHRMMTWPGPRIMISDPEAQPKRETRPSHPGDFVVIDFATAPASSFDALRIAIGRAARARIEMSGPLLFCNKEVPGKEVRRLEIAVRQDPWLIESKTDPTDGTFSKLVLGERIVTNPLFQGYFVNLHEGVTEMQIGGCLELMEQHLVWQRAEQS